MRHVRPKFGLFCATTPCHNSDIVSAIARRYGGQHEGQVDAGRKGMRRLWRCIAEAFATIGRLSFAGNVSVFSCYAAALAVQQSGACGSDLISEILATHTSVFYRHLVSAPTPQPHRFVEAFRRLVSAWRNDYCRDSHSYRASIERLQSDFPYGHDGGEPRVIT